MGNTACASICTIVAGILTLPDQKSKIFAIIGIKRLIQTGIPIVGGIFVFLVFVGFLYGFAMLLQ